MLKWCGSSHTKIQGNIPQLWSLGDDKWRSPNDADAVQQLLNYAGVADVDVFASDDGWAEE